MFKVYKSITSFAVFWLERWCCHVLLSVCHEWFLPKQYFYVTLSFFSKYCFLSWSYLWLSLFRPNRSLLYAARGALQQWTMFQSSSQLVFVSVFLIVVHVWREFALNPASCHWQYYLWTVFRRTVTCTCQLFQLQQGQNAVLKRQNAEHFARVSIALSLFWYK